jgi:hypothetical protein
MHSIPAELFGSASPASTPDWPAFLSAIDPEIPGLLVLAGALVCLWLTVHRLRRTVHSIEKRLESSAPVQAPPTTLAPHQPEAIDEGVLTAIAAAVVVALKQPHRIISVQPDASTQHAWSAEGRRELYHSHQIR